MCNASLDFYFFLLKKMLKLSLLLNCYRYFEIYIFLDVFDRGNLDRYNINHGFLQSGIWRDEREETNVLSLAFFRVVSFWR